MARIRSGRLEARRDAVINRDNFLTCSWIAHRELPALGIVRLMRTNLADKDDFTPVRTRQGQYPIEIDRSVEIQCWKSVAALFHCGERLTKYLAN